MKSKRILVVAVKFAVIGVTLSPLVPDARAGDENKGFDKKTAAVKTIPLDLFVAPEGMELPNRQGGKSG